MIRLFVYFLYVLSLCFSIGVLSNRMSPEYHGVALALLLVTIGLHTFDKRRENKRKEDEHWMRILTGEPEPVEDEFERFYSGFH